MKINKRIEERKTYHHLEQRNKKEKTWKLRTPRKQHQIKKIYKQNIIRSIK